MRASQSSGHVRSKTRYDGSQCSRIGKQRSIDETTARKINKKIEKGKREREREKERGREENEAGGSRGDSNSEMDFYPAQRVRQTSKVRWARYFDVYGMNGRHAESTGLSVKNERKTNKRRGARDVRAPLSNDCSNVDQTLPRRYLR